jgi:hypothetical protein
MRIAARRGVSDKHPRSREPVVPTVDPKEKAIADQKKAKRREIGGDADRGLDTGEFASYEEKREPDSTK